MTAAVVRRGGRIVLALVLALAGIWLFARLASPLSPVGVRLPPAPTAPATVPGAPSAVEVPGHYPEALAPGPDGRIVVGTEEGMLSLIALDEDAVAGSAQTFTRVDGHPIGLVPDVEKGGVWSATFPLGLQQVTEAGAVATIAKVSGTPLAFPDDVAVGPDGTVYVTDASSRWNPLTTAPDAPYVLWDLLEGRGNGRLIAYDPASGTAETVLDGLFFPSGVIPTPDATALLIVEVSRYRVLRYALDGASAGQVSVFADNLPGIPDDVFIGPEGAIWVSVAAPRSALVDRRVMPYPTLVRLVTSLPYDWQNALLAPVEGGGSLLKLGDQGDVLCRITVPAGPPPANGIAWHGRLVLGRLGGNELLVVDPELCSPR